MGLLRLLVSFVLTVVGTMGIIYLLLLCIR